MKGCAAEAPPGVTQRRPQFSTAAGTSKPRLPPARGFWKRTPISWHLEDSYRDQETGCSARWAHLSHSPPANTQRCVDVCREGHKPTPCGGVTAHKYTNISPPPPPPAPALRLLISPLTIFAFHSALLLLSSVSCKLLWIQTSGFEMVVTFYRSGVWEFGVFRCYSL